VINLHGLDLNLLTVFKAIYEAGSITRTAESWAARARAGCACRAWVGGSCRRM